MKYIFITLLEEITIMGSVQYLYKFKKLLCKPTGSSLLKTYNPYIFLLSMKHLEEKEDISNVDAAYLNIFNYA